LTLLSQVELEEYLSDRLSRKVDIVLGPNIKPLIKEGVYQDVLLPYFRASPLATSILHRHPTYKLRETG